MIKLQTGYMLNLNRKFIASEFYWHLMHVLAVCFINMDVDV